MILELMSAIAACVGGKIHLITNRRLHPSLRNVDRDLAAADYPYSPDSLLVAHPLPLRHIEA